VGAAVFGDLLGALDAALERRGDDPALAVAREAWAVLERDAAGLEEVGSRLDVLAHRLALTDLDARLLAVALLPELHPAGHLLLGVLGGDERAGRPPVALGYELAGVSLVSGTARARLGELAPLRRFGVLSLVGDDVFLARRLRVGDRVVAHLVGDDTPPAALAAVIAPAVPVAVEGTDTVAGALADGAPLVWVASVPGAAGTALAVAACRELDVVCLVANLARAVSDPGAPEATGGARPGGTGAAGTPSAAAVHDLVRTLLLEAALTGSVLVLAGAEAAGPAMDLLTDAPVPVIAVGATRWDARWARDLPPEVTAPRLSLGQRRDEWRAALGLAEPAREVTALRLTPEEIRVVGRAVRAGMAGPVPVDGAARPLHGADGPVPGAAAAVTAAARRLGRAAPTTGRGLPLTLEDLVLPDHTRAEVERLIGWGRHRDDVLALGPLQGKGGKAGGIAALFSGSPGTGKTLAAHVVADALGMELYQVDLTTIVDKYIGETEKNLERVFAEAESLNCVLFFDEADSLFGSRSSVNDARDRYANQEVAYLLQRMESFDGITVLATNLRGNLDQAFARRLHFMIHFPDPDEATRRRLWEHHLAPLELDAADRVDVPALAAHLELAGGDIRNVVLSATFEAVRAGRAVGMGDLHGAAAREYAKLGRRAPAAVLAPPVAAGGALAAAARATQ
ncbi:AAA family ATPase, partial [Georgenia ruanii]|nr:AAA family ATPase [Georgenia ruanii]